MEHRIARAVSAGGISGGVAGAVAGSAAVSYTHLDVYKRQAGDKRKREPT